MKLRIGIIVALLGIAATAAVTTGCTSDNYSDRHHQHVYSCPMHPEITMGQEGNCSKCGMALTRTVK